MKTVNPKRINQNLSLMNFKYLIVFALLCGSNLAKAQNTFPANGAVGVGTTDPEAPLHVFVGPDSKPNGVVATSQSALRLTRYGTPNYSYNESAEFKITHGGPSVWGSRLDLYINGANNQSNIPDQHAMTWQYNGNVGIGTIDPNARLDVDGTMRLSGHSANLDAGGNPTEYLNLAGTGKMLIGWNRSAGNGETDFVANEGAGSLGGFAFYSFNNASQEKQLLRILGNGNIGIGINFPTDKLSVNGNIRAKEIKVEATNWPDYVFEAGYQVGTLEALESYIRTNKHLPGIPNAKEAESNGVDLGDLVKKLLKNQEELTLHVVAQEKKIKALEKQLIEKQKKTAKTKRK